MLVIIQFTDDTPQLEIEVQEVVHCNNGLEKLIIDENLEIAFPIHRINQIAYHLQV